MSSIHTFDNLVISDTKLISPLKNQIIHGDTTEIVHSLPDNTYSTCITSPPYWGIRDYGVENQIGAEPLINDFIQNLVRIFRVIKDKLKDDGTLWLNLGDSYTSGNRKWRAPDKKNPGRAMSFRPPTPAGLKPKDLIGVPWKVAFALQEDGWYLRSDIIWHKPNCQPESVKDRPTQSHEYVFLLSKSPKYYYDYKKLKESTQKPGIFRNRRTVWSVNTESYKGAHFATFPLGLILPMVEGGSKVGDVILDPFFGAGTLGLACLHTGRLFHGIEVNKDYVDLAQERINTYKNGRLF
jgi:DNA modification methylase